MARMGLKKPPARHSLRPKPYTSNPPSVAPRLLVVSTASPVAVAPSPSVPHMPAEAPNSAHAHEPATVPGGDTDHDDHAYLHHAYLHVEHVEGLSRSFFSRAPEHASFDVWDDSTALPMPHSSRRAMHATLLILGISALLVGGFLIYQKVIMPVPAELGAGATMPPVFPMPAEPTANTALRSPAVFAAPHAAAVPDVAAPSQVPVAAQAAPVEVAPVPDTEPSAAAPSALPEAPVVGAVVGAEPAYASLLAAAEALRGRGRRAELSAAYEQILTVYPDATDVLRKLAYLHLDTRNNARAHELAVRATTLEPTNAEGWIVLGAAREGLGDRPGARDAYRRCAALGEGEFSNECRRLVR